MKASPIIRPATRDDVPILLELIRALASYERLAHLVEADEKRLVEHLFGPNSRVEALLAFADGAAVGFAVYFHNFSTFLGRKGLYLEDLFVRPEYRGHGHGRALLGRIARIAHERGCGRLEWMALDWNEPAIRFYKSLGAVEMAEWRLFRMTGDAIARLARLPDAPS